jgi:aryl-alcohol dehydrogenase-like predicted oxidoreductase
MTRDTRNWTRREAIKLMAAAGALGLAPRRLLATSDKMLKRTIPSSGQGLPVVGLGTSRVFDVGPSEAALAPLAEVLTILSDHGGSVVDTSPMYGRAEEVTGRLADRTGLSGKLFLATKVWTEGRAPGITQIDESFRLLRTDMIDLIQVHNLIDWQVHLETLKSLKEEGRIRYTGITHYRTDAFPVLEEVMLSADWDFVQLNYSILTPEAQERLLPLAQEREIAVLVNRPFERGGTFHQVRNLELPSWAGELDIASWGQFFLKWIIGHPAVTCVIPGTSKPEHMLDNVGAGIGRLPDEQQRKEMRKYVLG